jgi:hypothetical protein
MQYVETWEELSTIINFLLQECLKEIAEETTRQLKFYVETVWYGSYTPEIYIRTYNLLESFVNSGVESKSGGFNVDIFSDTSKIIPNLLPDNLWNQHMGFDNKTPFTGGLIETLENGNPSPYYSHDGIQMFEQTAKWLEKNLILISKKVFNSYGINLFIK